MKRFLALTIVSLLQLATTATAQWPVERKQPYDACSPTAPQKEAAATQLSVFPTGEVRLTTGKQLAADARVLQLNAWRGERCSAQLAIRANGPASQLSVSCSGLSKDSNHIPVQLGMLRYTKAHGTPTADIIGTERSCDNPSGVDRVVWVQIDVPQQAEPGIYRGIIEITAAGGLKTQQAVQLEVQPGTLSTPSQWAMHLDLWQHPQAVARWHDAEPWSDEHFALLRPIMKRLADAGQKCITCTVLDEAWNGQTYDTFPSMVRWIRGGDGRMRYDYSILDKWVRFMHDDIGIREQISCYTMIPWHLSVQFFDETTGKYDSIKATPGTREYEALWAPFLEDFHRHMQKMGWAGKTCIAIDERPDAYVRAAMKLVREKAPEFRVAMAVDKPSDLTREVYNISPVLTHAGSALGDLLRERREAGKITTFYVCLHPRKPNSFTFSPPAETEWLGLFAAANHLNGFLRWAYNSWNRNPFESTDFIHWPSGDCFLVYPGNRSSVRFERLRDGIEEYEKVHQLRQQASRSAEAAAVVEEMNTRLAEIFTVARSKGNDHAQDVQQARDIINKAAILLSSKHGTLVP